MLCKERYPFDVQYGCINEVGHLKRRVPHSTSDGRTWVAGREYANPPIDPQLSDEQTTRIAKRVFEYLAAAEMGYGGCEPVLTPTAANCHEFVVPRIKEAILSVTRQP